MSHDGITDPNEHLYKTGKLNPFSKPDSNSSWGVNGSHQQHKSMPKPTDNPSHGAKGGDQY